MARTKQTARKTPKEGDSTQAHSLVAAVAAAQSLARARSARKPNPYIMRNPQQGQEQREGHAQGQLQGEVGQAQQQQAHQQEQVQRMEVEREEQQRGDTQVHQENPQLAVIVYDPNIFRDLANISNVGPPYPLTAHRTPLEILQEQTRLQDFEEERQRQMRVFEDAQREVARQRVEEENRRAAEALQAKMEQREPVKKR